jgi:hypothetical protein
MSNYQSNILIKILENVPNVIELPNPLLTYYIYLSLEDDGSYTFNYTTVQPTFGSQLPDSPVNDQHFFNTKNATYEIWDGNTWKDVTRIFLARVDPGFILDLNPVGISEVGLNSPTYSGLLLKESDGTPIKKSQDINKKSFLTDIDVLDFQNNIYAELPEEIYKELVVAVEYIPAYSMVTVKDKEASLCSSQFDYPVFGIVTEKASSGKLINVITKGFITNNNWAFTNINGPVWLSKTGQPTDVFSDNFVSLQMIGTVINNNTIYLNIFPQQLIGTS